MAGQAAGTELGRARAFLRDTAERCQRRCQPEMPGVRTLSRRADVSYSTMLRAAHSLVSEGCLEIVHGRRMRVAGVRTVREESPEPAQPWRALEQRIRQDVLTGEFRTGEPLPRRKELRLRYGATSHSTRKAIDSLVREGTLHCCGRALWGATPVRRGEPEGTIVYIVRTRGGGLPMVFASRSSETAQALDEECARRGVRLSLSFCHSVGQRQVFDDGWLDRSRQSVTKQGVLGFIVDSSSVYRQLDELVPALCRFRLPVSVIMDSPPSREPASAVGDLPPRARVALVRALMDREAGRAVGSYLLSRGHRRIAYLGVPPSTSWSADRADGLVEAVERSGMHAEVVPFYVQHEGILHPREFDRRLRDSVGHAMAGILQQAAGASAYNETAFLRRFRASSLDYQSLMSRAPLWSIPGFEPTARLALERRDITAWVCANEGMALLASDYLVANGVRVPDDLSVVGIDDVRETLTRRLTMYSFRPHAAIGAAVNSILHPHLLGPGHEGVREICIEGALRERESAASVPGR